MYSKISKSLETISLANLHDIAYKHVIFYGLACCKKNAENIRN